MRRLSIELVRARGSRGVVHAVPMETATQGSDVDARTRRRWVVIVLAAVLAVLSVVTVIAWRGIGSRTDTAQVTGYWAESPTTLVVVYVRAKDARLVEAYADETPTRVTLHVLVSAPPTFGGSSAGGAIYTSTRITLAAPLSDREVVTVEGDPVNEGRYPVPLPVDTP
jgi:hypothetical protein